ncbi:DUF2064 domain-containing protein [Halobacterium litoreum]|uniref:DUF2064 domain-containing protein n=1 Tax=Halobacterium litoreum TaxID=2039234 RepID=A0ABD5NBW8_9EURY|nr:DUF2064 domain-containing protein [Halobacterium litoreum]UHH14424.1 DUF2064 domain-containing protein [Halobacterium litoreum]
MTVVAVTLDPPRDGLVLPALPETSPLSASEATELYEAMAADAFLAAAESGGDLLVNYRSDDQLPDEHVPEGADAEAAVRALVDDVLDDEQAEDARVEVQVGSSKSARVGNTITHLLESEGANSAAVLEPDAPLFLRKDVDSAAMKLRRSPVVLGPAREGQLYFAGFREPIDFADAFEAPALENVNARAVDAGRDVDFLASVGRVRTGEDLVSLVSELRARRAAGRLVPAYTTAFVEDRGLRVEAEDGDRFLVRE